MQPIFEAVAVLAALLLVLRASIRRGQDTLRLRGGIVLQNLVTGVLTGVAAAVLIRDASGRAMAGSAGPSAPATGAYGDLAAAMLRVLPILGALLGGLAGHEIFGALWRRFLRLGPASARAWLRRIQFSLCGAALVFLIRRLFH